MPAPRVSVLVPARDAAATVGEALASLGIDGGAAAGLARGEVEVVLVDDGSVDGTADAAAAVAGAARWLRVVSPGRVGLVEALIAGVAACRGELVARMDADDLADPRRLALQARFLDERPDVGLVGARVASFSREPLGGGWRAYDAWQNALLEHDDIARALFIESPLAHPSVMLRRSALDAVGGYRPTEPGWPEDYDLWLRLLAAGVRFAKLPEVLLHWRDHPGRLSRTSPRYAPEAFLACRAHHLARGPLAGRGEVAIWGAGRGGRRLARALRSHGVGAAAFVDVDPRKIGRRVGGAAVLDPESLPSLRARGLVLLAAVGSRGARDLIRPRATAAGYVEGADFFCAA